MKVLIIANARWNGCPSGSDMIYTNFHWHWPSEFEVWEMRGIDFKPFFLCYLYRIILSIFKAIFYYTKWEKNNEKIDIVYSASDFLMDSIPALIISRIRGAKWVAGFFLFAPKRNIPYFCLQKIAKFFIDRYADMVVVTNPSMYLGFIGKKKTWINGGIYLNAIGLLGKKVHKKYDAVFCGRIHPSKGIDELLRIWAKVLLKKPDASLAIIGDGDLGVWYVERSIMTSSIPMRNVAVFGYLGFTRLKIFADSKMVLYPTPKEHDHFSISPVEAMACGCPMVAFDIPVMGFMKPAGTLLACTEQEFADCIIRLIDNPEEMGALASEAAEWAKSFEYKKEALRVFEDIKKGVLDD